MVSANNSINDTVGASISGVTNTLTVTNPSNTASSAARETITVGGASAGDPISQWDISGVTTWSMGIDNSDSDNLKMNPSGSLGASDTWVMTTAGERTMPLQPAFAAVLKTAVSNVTGDNSTYYLGDTDLGAALTALFDQNSDFTTGASGGAYFTAPIDGTYIVGAAVYATGVTSAMGNLTFAIITTSGGEATIQGHAANMRTSSNDFQCCGSQILQMDMGDVFRASARLNGGSKVVDIGTNGDNFILTGMWASLHV